MIKVISVHTPILIKGVIVIIRTSRKLTKMIDKAKEIKVSSIYPVHIIENTGYCAACAGECKHYNTDNMERPKDMVFIIDDIPEDCTPGYDHLSAEVLTMILDGKYIMKSRGK